MEKTKKLKEQILLMKLETSSNEDTYSEDESYIENSCDDSSYSINYSSSDTETE